MEPSHNHHAGMSHGIHHSSHQALPSFSSRRPATETLPAFNMPQRGSDVPRIGAEGISPGLSSVHTTSSHSSQAPHQVPQQYTYGNGIGAWQSANGGSGNYAVTSPSHPRPSYPQVYGSRPGMYSQQQHHGVAHVDQRSPQSPMPSADALAGTAYEHPDHHGFQTPAGQSNAQHATQAHSNPSPAHQMSQPAMSSQVDAYSSSRAPGSFPNTTASPSQQGSFAAYAPLPSPVHHSPTTGFGPRGGLVSPGGSYGPGAGSGMAPPAGYRPYQHFPQPMSSMNGHMLNGGVPQHGDQISQHGAQMSMMPTMMSTYNQQLMYPTPPPATMDRPFRCDQCVQSFSRNHDLKRHKRIHLAIKPFPCNFCNKTFSRKDALKRHRLVKGCEKKAKQIDGSEMGHDHANESSPESETSDGRS